MNTASRKFATRALGAVPAFVRAHDAAVDLRRHVVDTASDVAYSTKRAIRRTRRDAEQGVEDAQHGIRKNPLRSVALAALAGSFVGAVTALVMRRRRTGS